MKGVMFMKKLYNAYVVKNMVHYFEECLGKRKDKVKVVDVSSVISENGESLMYYLLEAEEGVIDSRWELK